MPAKRTLSMYWAAGCGGCEISVVNLHESLLDVLARADLVFCPCLMDTKLSDLEAMPDGGIDVTLFNGAMRNEDNIEMARLLRRKSAVLVAYGSCANTGSIPGLSNLSTLEDHLSTVYAHQPSLDNPRGVVPQPRSEVPEGTLELPTLVDRVLTLHDIVDVDYTIPGCPPEPAATAAALLTLLDGVDLPPKGSFLGCGSSSVCAECSRRREGKRITAFHRTWQVDPDPELCLLEQGVVCMGVATRQGCGALCPTVNMPCIGCYGPPPDVSDQGTAMVGALGAAIDIAPAAGLRDGEVAEHMDAVLDAIPDWTGTFYKFSLPHSAMDAVVARRPAPQTAEQPAPRPTPRPTPRPRPTPAPRPAAPVRPRPPQH